MEEAGLPPMIDATLTADARSAEPALRKHMAVSPPEAVFTLKNSVTAATYQTLQKLRIPIPSQVALLGFDDFDMAQTLRPAISVIQQPIEEVGRQAAQLLFAHVDAARSGTAGKRRKSAPTVLRSTLLIRGSCGCKKRESC